MGEISLKRERIIWLDLLRIFAAIMVCFIHVSSDKFFSVSTSSAEFRIFTFYDLLNQIAVPLFVMISGAMMLDPSRPLSPKSLSKKIVKLITALVFWMTINGIYIAITEPHNITSIKSFIERALESRQYFWFIFMMIGLYLITPLLKCISKDIKYCEYFFLLFFIFGCLIPFAIEMIGVFKLTQFSFIKKYYEYMKFSFPLGYTSYYVAGFILTKKHITKKIEISLYILCVLLTLSSLYATINLSVLRGKPYTFFFSFSSPNIVISSLAVFILFKNRVSKILKEASFSMQKIKTLSGLTFGTYLCHMYLLYILNILKFTTLSFNPILSVPIISIIIFSVSAIIVLLLKKIPFIKSYVC